MLVIALVISFLMSKSFTDPIAAVGESLKALADGEADMVLGVGDVEGAEFHTQMLACDAKTQSLLEERGLDANVGLTFLSKDSGLIDHSSSFLCSQEQLGQTQTVAQFYDRNLLWMNKLMVDFGDSSFQFVIFF